MELQRAQLKFERKIHRLTQQQLSDLVGVNKNTVSGWEQGRIIPTPNNIKKLAIALDIEVSKLV